MNMEPPCRHGVADSAHDIHNVHRGWVVGLVVLLANFVSFGPAAAQSDGFSVEACIGCHALGEPAPVGNISNRIDLHYVDLDPDGPATDSGLRQLNGVVDSVDVTGRNTIVDFTVSDENGAGFASVFDSDGRLVLAKLLPGPVEGDPDTSGDPSEWIRLVEERFTAGGVFENRGGGSYRFTGNFDPTSVPIAVGDTLRAAIQLSASDIPAANFWCDFDASLTVANDCVSPTRLTRDIVQTETCNGCHGTTSDTKLSFHGGGRTEVEYCVTCHNPDRNADTGMTTLIHKIHYGSQLTQPYLGGNYSHVNFTRDIDNCTSCHEQGGADQGNWKTEPNRESCGSCHDDVNFDTGDNHGSGGQQLTNLFCANCHPVNGPLTPSLRPVATVHVGMARADEGARYRGDDNGFAVIRATFDRNAETVTADFSVTRDGMRLDLTSDPAFTNGGSLNLNLAWASDDYTNEASGSSPAQPIRVSGLDIGNTVMDNGDGSYRTVFDVSTFGFGTATVVLQGFPVAEVLGVGSFERIAVKSAFRHVSLEARTPVLARRDVIDIGKCNACHDADGAGLSLHGTNRTGEMQVCVVCHNPDATDINQRPADPSQTPDGKREESIDMKRMVHQIHMGEDLQEQLVVYGFGQRSHEYGEVNFIGNSQNCLTCHLPNTYSTDDAWQTAPSTIDTGADVTNPADDLNISPTTAVCSSCHDAQRATEHIVANGGTFASLDDEILRPAPEPRSLQLAAVALCTLAVLAGRRRS